MIPVLSLDSSGSGAIARFCGKVKFTARASPATIVVVERESAAQELIDQALRGSGHRVLMTTDPLEALQLGQRVRIDVLVDDVELSDQRPTLVERLRSVQPEMRIVRVLDPDERNLSELNGGVVLRRPFSLDELERAVEQALAEESAID